MDVGIVGGGLVGVALAVALREGGARVTVFERGQLGSEASTAAGGMLGAQTEAHDDAPPLAELVAARTATLEWAEHLGDIGLSRRGVLKLAFTDAELASLAGSPGELVQATRIGELEPAAATTAVGGLFCGDDAHVDPPRYFAAVLAEARRLEAELHEGVSVRAVGQDGDGAHVDGRRFDRVVLTTGSWASELDPALAVRPIRGQMLELRLPARPFGPVLQVGGVYSIPRADGRVTVGSTMEDVGHRRGVDAGGIHALLQGALQAAPILRGAELVRTWSSFRPMRAAGVIAGPTATPGVFALTGHHRNGILLARASSLALAKQLLA